MRKTIVDIQRAVDHVDMDSEKSLRRLFDSMYNPLSWTLFKAICTRLGYTQKEDRISDALLKGNLF